LLYFEKKFKNQGVELVIGVDEAGRGPLAGPVVAAAVVLNTTFFDNRIDDSKKLTPEQREKVFPEIIRKSIFGIGIVNEKIIDKVNILVATGIAMDQAIISLLDKFPENRRKRVHVLVDGNVSLKTGYPYTNIIKGDGRSKSIAAASILAKVTRDRIMQEYDRVYPQYGFLKHKGYPTRMHKQAIRDFGLSSIHRVTFSSG